MHVELFGKFSVRINLWNKVVLTAVYAASEEEANPKQNTWFQWIWAVFGLSSERKTTEIAAFLHFYLSLWELSTFSVSSHTAARTELFKPPASASSSFTDIFWDYSIEFRVIEEQGDGEHVISLCLVESRIVNAQHTQRWEIQHHLHSKDLICHTAKNKVLHWIDMLTGDSICVSVSSVWQQIEMTNPFRPIYTLKLGCILFAIQEGRKGFRWIENGTKGGSECKSIQSQLLDPRRLTEFHMQTSRHWF